MLAMEGEQNYEILDGVRRAKAAELSGHSTIPVKLNGVGEEFLVPLRNLYSPKSVIDTSGVRGLDWYKILRATKRGQILPAIEVAIGSRGIPIEKVSVPDDDISLFR